MTQPVISLDDVTVRYGDLEAIKGFTLEVDNGSLVALVGPSGCGKTTALRTIAGFEQPTTGTITIRGQIVSGENTMVAPERRNVGMVFQEYALFPHISVAENVGYGVRGSDRVRRVKEVLALVGLDNHGDRFPHELSGGEQQRVALARALAPEPDVVLLDEPFSNLDAPQRERMRRELRKILKTARVTAIFVTHDQAEALAIADVIAVMRDGHIRQVGVPDDVYAAPVSPWVAKFLGDAVLFDGTAAGGSVATVLGSVPTVLPDGTNAKVMIRPEWIMPTTTDNGTGLVVDREFYGHDQRVEIELDEGDVIEALVPTRKAIHVGDRVAIELADSIVYEV
ncbi:MAG: ABC transporter ATP-binding protein [Acidimicrobiia bacterium]|nr:MAG: ABC transporter ATP-binding protein [Acidimicrobiia bacterium]